MVTIIDRRAAFHADHLAANISMSQAAVQLFLERHQPIASLAALVSREAESLGFADAYFVSGVCALLLVPVALLYPARRPRPAAPTGESV